eukprot:TRINITY_DN41335_c0_g1_i1.p1 TRINITY_DN41335_c0_g1~~TRINITY_DN41335_c0_g1_i1.p1  ORF type:complete len:407 (-),score=49.01 TRINITY_DN41335_c0_g1_i1:39-1259(-)
MTDGVSRRQRATGIELEGVSHQDEPQTVPDVDTNEKDANAEKPRAHVPACKRFLASPFWKCTTMSIVGFTPVWGCFLALPKILQIRGIASWTVPWLLHFAFALWVSVMFVYNFVSTQWTDPGGTKAVKPAQETTGQFAMGKVVEDEPELYYAPNWCQKCAHWKPPRSHHCSMCNRCVLRMDHHCPFTGTCIGMRNHGHFILFYFFAAIGLLYSLIQCGLSLMSNSGLSSDKLSSLSKILHGSQWGVTGFLVSLLMDVMLMKGLEIMVQVAVSVVALVSVLGMGCPAAYLVLQNVTTMERLFPMKEYVQIQDQVFCPLGPGFYSQTMKQNAKDILGEKWWLRLLLPVSGGPIDLTPGVCPKPSQAGVQALADRLKEVRERGVQHQVTSTAELGFDVGPAAKQCATTV